MGKGRRLGDNCPARDLRRFSGGERDVEAGKVGIEDGLRRKRGDSGHFGVAESHLTQADAQ